MSALPTPTLPPSLARLQAAFDALMSQPDTLAEARQAAFGEFLSRGYPGPRDEQWKYTQLRRLESRSFTLARPVPAAAAAVAMALADGYRAVFVDGAFQAAASRLPAGTTGISVRALSTVLQAPGSTLPDAGPGPRATAFEYLNLAFLQDGLLVELDDDAALDAPLQVSFQWTDAAPARMNHPRILVRAGRRTSLTVVEHYAGTATTEQFTNAVTYIRLADGARVEHCRLQEEPSSVFHLAAVRAEVGRDARYVNHNFMLGGTLARVDVSARLSGPGAEATLNGLQFAAGAQHLDTHTHVDHAVAHTVSTEDYRGIADGRGRVVFNGKVQVHEKAIKTDARQSSRNLLLSATAEIDTKPELEIYADDVKCAHGATVGQLDASALFYLQSRGIGQEEARALLTYAFADAVIARLSLPEVRAHLVRAVHARFGIEETISP